jgi:selenide,water dikinase
VVTTDFVTPVVDDPRTWGRIAAQNAVSDVWAMGGRPLFALNLVAWPRDELPLALLAEVLQGGAEIGAESGFVIVGGHSVDDPEPKYGLAVVGEVAPEKILTNTGLRHGDALVLTKALGIGVATTAIKRGEASAALAAAAVASMTASNGPAARAALAAGAAGATDVTGFGLLGHLARMAAASGVDAEIDVAAVPFPAGVRGLAAAGVVPGGSRRNLDSVTPLLDDGGYGEVDRLLLADAQTSGGLLFGAAPERAAAAVAELGPPAAMVGRVRAGSGRIRLR